VRIPLSCRPKTIAYETLRRKRASAPTPEAISARLAAKVSAGASGGPPLLGSAVAVAVAVAVGLADAVAVAVGLAVAVAVAVAVEVAVDMAVWWVAKATGANSRTITTVVLNRNSTFFMKYLLHRVVRAPHNKGHSPTFPFPNIVGG